MISFFAIPKSFTGPFRTIQVNALKNWFKINQSGEIIIFGDECKMTQILSSFPVRHITRIKRNRFGTPLLSDAFRQAKAIAQNNFLLYLNADIMFLEDLSKVLKKIKLKKFLLTGRRRNLNFNKNYSFPQNWKKDLKKEVEKRGKLFNAGGLDYFLFPKKINWRFPDFTVGRTAWDNWFVYQAKKLKIPVIDATSVITAIHQNHDYSHAGGYKAVWRGPEREENRRLVGDLRRLFNLKDADFILTPQGLKRPPLTWATVYRQIERFPILHPGVDSFFKLIIKLKNKIREL